MKSQRLAALQIVPFILLVGLGLPAAGVEVDANELARCSAITTIDQRVACYDALAASALSVSGAGSSAAKTSPREAAAPGGVAEASPAPRVAGQPAAPAQATGPIQGAGSTQAPFDRAGANQPAPNQTGPNQALSNQPAPAASALNPSDPANFGLSLRQLKAVPAGPDSIKAIVSQMTEDRLHNISLVLDNGQTWGFIEPEPRVRPGDTVTIKRAALGSFLMITPSRHSYRVQRVN